MIQVTSWTPRYPYLQRFIKHPESAEALAQLTDEMRNVFQFYDSKIKYEIRIADIIASAYFRRFVKNEISLGADVGRHGELPVLDLGHDVLLLCDAGGPRQELYSLALLAAHAERL